MSIGHWSKKKQSTRSAASEVMNIHELCNKTEVIKLDETEDN